MKIGLLCELWDTSEGLCNTAERKHELLLIAVFQDRIEVLCRKLRVFVEAFQRSKHRGIILGNASHVV